MRGIAPILPGPDGQDGCRPEPVERKTDLRFCRYVAMFHALLVVVCRADDLLRPTGLVSATNQSRCLMCGAPTPAAHRSAAPTAYPSASKSARTAESHALPSPLAT